MMSSIMGFPYKIAYGTLMHQSGCASALSTILSRMRLLYPQTASEEPD